MVSKWRDMTLAQLYPYWILGEVPDADVPYAACNDMLAGNMADEIVAVAALTQQDLVEVGELLPRAFAHLGLPTMSAKNAAKLFVLERMRTIAQKIFLREEDPLRGANAIYSCAVEAGLVGDNNGVNPQVAVYAAEFLQLADALEVRQGDPIRRRQFEDLIIEASEALLTGKPAPQWHE